MQSTKTTLLIVDDTPANISVLFEMLDKKAFKIVIAQDGETALSRAEITRPDLILLDVMMPGIDGYETCRRFKQSAKMRDIPIIFMSALNDPVDKVRGLEMGAVDYISKPINLGETLARINTHLSISRLQLALEEKNDELSAFGHTVAHDLKTPLNCIINNIEMVMEDHAERLDAMGKSGLEDSIELGWNMNEIINSLLLLAGICHQTALIEPIDMAQLLPRVERRLARILKRTQGKIIHPPSWPTALAFAPWVEEIWANYLSNGLKYGGTPPVLELGAIEYERHIRFWVRDNGDGLNDAAQEKLFKLFSRAHGDEIEGHGLGLSIVQRIAEKLNGQCGVESEVGRGSTFYFTLPIQ